MSNFLMNYRGQVTCGTIVHFFKQKFYLYLIANNQLTEVASTRDIIEHYQRQSFENLYFLTNGTCNLKYIKVQ